MNANSTSTRNILGDIGNRLLHSNTQFFNSNLKPDFIPEEQNLIKKCQSASALDINKNEIGQKEELNKDQHQQRIAEIEKLPKNDNIYVPEYSRDIFKYLFKQEKSNQISINFYKNIKDLADIRANLINSLVKIHFKLNLVPEVIYLAVQIMDYYIEVKRVSEEELLLLSATSLFIAAKYESRSLSLETIARMTTKHYNKSDIKRMEVDILNTINFSISKPVPISFLRRFSMAAKADPIEHTFAKYLMELSLLDIEFSSLFPSYLAASALYISLKLIYERDWNSTLQYYSSYCSKNLRHGVQKLAELVLKAITDDFQYKEVNRKYDRNPDFKISSIIEDNREEIKEIAAGNF